MTKCYSAENVKQGIRSYFECHSFRRASNITGFPKSTIWDWVARIAKRLQRPKRKKIRKYLPRKHGCITSCVNQLLSDNPILTLRMLQYEMANRGIHTSISTVQRVVRSIGMTYQAISWRANIMSIDETGVLSNRYTLRGYGKRGKRLSDRLAQTKTFQSHLYCGDYEQRGGFCTKCRRQRKRPDVQ
jgi:transposase